MNKIVSLVMVSIAAFVETGCFERPNFELYNKSKDTVWVTLKKGSHAAAVIVGRFQSKPGDQTQLSIDTSTPTRLEICSEAEESFDEMFKRAQQSGALQRAEESKQAFVFEPKCPDREYELPAKKTLYLSLGSEWQVYPETGPLRGWRGVTESNLPLKNNLRSSEVTLISSSVKVKERFASKKQPSKKERGWQKLA